MIYLLTAVCSKIHRYKCCLFRPKQNAQTSSCLQNVEMLYVKTASKYRNHWALMVKYFTEHHQDIEIVRHKMG